LENAFNAVVIGVLQGIIEWLPISSQGNLVLFMVYLLGSDIEVVIDYSVYLHLGTGIAALVFFREDIFRILRPKKDGEKKLLMFLFISTVLTGLIGYPLFVLVRTISIYGEFLIALTGIALIFTGIIQKRSKEESMGKIDNIRTGDGFLLGFVQGFSIIPGISRSGITTSALIFRGYDVGEALKLSFLMSVPASFAANLGLFIIEGVPSVNNWIIISVIASFVTSYFFIRLLLGLVRKIEFWRLCFLLGVIAILAFIPSLLSLL
jgi:undecaprenyl-diphosphatase